MIDAAILSIPDSPMHERLVGQVVFRLAQSNGIAFRRIKTGVMVFRTEIVADRTGWRCRMFCDLIRPGPVELMRQEIGDLAVLPMNIGNPELYEVIQSPSRRRKRTVSLADLIEQFKSDPNRKDMHKKVEIDYARLFRAMDEAIGYSVIFAR